MVVTKSSYVKYVVGERAMTLSSSTQIKSITHLVLPACWNDTAEISDPEAAELLVAQDVRSVDVGFVRPGVVAPDRWLLVGPSSNEDL